MLSRLCQSLVFFYPLRLCILYFNFIGKKFQKNSELEGGNVLYHKLTSVLSPTIERDGLIFDASTKTPASRAARLREKEPDTINWLEDNLRPDDVFYDIGANVGVYSLYAAMRCAHVIAFEPESLNYACLNKNIFLNGLDEKITALNIALYDKDLVSKLNISNFQEGKSGHNFHHEVDHDLAPSTPVFKQSVVGLRLDSFVQKFGLEKPSVIKIDVDGQERRIILGLGQLLADPRLRTIAVETDSRVREHLEIRGELEKFGFKLSKNPRYLNLDYREAGVENMFYFR
jgi:FkbM family methyltransferase